MHSRRVDWDRFLHGKESIMKLVEQIKAAALIVALVVSIGPAWAANATTFTTSGALPIISHDGTQFGPTMILKENFAGAL